MGLHCVTGAYASHLQLLLQTLNHVKSVRINVCAASVVIEYAADRVPLTEFIQAVVARFENEIDGSPRL